MVDTSAIDRAPVDIEGAGLSPELEAAYLTIGQFAEDLAAAESELVSVRDRKTVEQVKAQILEEYVNKVFIFVSFYCGTVGVFLFLSALPGDSFELPETILGIIAGSTAVSVIGLIGLVISGLFGGKPTAS